MRKSKFVSRIGGGSESRNTKAKKNKNVEVQEGGEIKRRVNHVFLDNRLTSSVSQTIRLKMVEYSVEWAKTGQKVKIITLICLFTSPLFICPS